MRLAEKREIDRQKFQLQVRAYCCTLLSINRILDLSNANNEYMDVWAISKQIEFTYCYIERTNE